MSIFKCKMCGGKLEIAEETSVCECEYCGSKQTVSTIDDEKIIKLYDRANRLRMANEFDKAAGVYESIIAESDTEAEAYWGLVLCKYGIEYVDDPATGKKTPTCHRSSFDSVMKDESFEMVMENTDTLAMSVYREQAKAIEEIRKGIIEVSSKEEPYDVFICYKETDENGERTIDSVMAQDVYKELTNEGYRVFFSRISLEDKLGQEYEPYIFAALNSAKVMLAFGTKYEYYNAVWVKNEWSRFLRLIANGQKKTLVPCYKDIDVYDMPEEFARLQAQDMSKVGAIQDLIHGITKIIPRNNYNQSAETISSIGIHKNIDVILQRGTLALEDGEWESANSFFEEVLNQNPQCVEAYLGKLMADLKVCSIEALEQVAEPFDENNNYKKLKRYGDETLLCRLAEYNDAIEYRNKQAKYNRIYMSGKEKLSHRKYEEAISLFMQIQGYMDSRELIEKAKSIMEQEKADMEAEAKRNKELQEMQEENLKKIVSSIQKMLIDEYEGKLKISRQLDEELKELQKQADIKKQRIEELSNEWKSAKFFFGRTKSVVTNEIKEMSRDKASLEQKIKDKKEEIQGSGNITIKIEDALYYLKEKMGLPYNENGIFLQKEEIYESLNNNSVVDSLTATYPELADLVEDFKLKLILLKNGDSIKFGVYENKVLSYGAKNENQPISWIVLKRDNGKILLLSEKLLDYLPCFDEPISERLASYENSSIRKWLNNQFYTGAFNMQEKNLIVETKIICENSSEEQIINDKVFLLSEEEVATLLPKGLGSQCTYLARYKKNNPGYFEDYYKNNDGEWWLRDYVGDRKFKYAYKDSVYSGGNYGSVKRGIRPAIWIDVNKIV